MQFRAGLSIIVLALAIAVLTGVARAQTPARDIDLIAEMDALWAQRGWPDPMEGSIILGRKGLKTEGWNYEATWRTARALWWSGHTAGDEGVTRRYCYEAMQLGEAAIRLDPNRVEGYFYAAVATGEYATTLSVSAAIVKGVAPKVEHAALKAYEIDKHYDGGGPMTTLGRFYSMLPWPLQDLEKSRRYLEELRATHPDALTGRFYLAETYYKLGELPLAKQELEFVALAVAPDDNAPIRPPPGELASQRLAQWFLVVAPERGATAALIGADDEQVARTPR